MKLYILRHGQTEWNKQGRLQGKSDTELSEAGISQAKVVADKLKHISFDFVYTSNLKRAMDTAKIVSGRKDVITDDRLQELAFGRHEGTYLESRRLGEYDSEELNQLARAFYAPDEYVPVEDGETFEHLLERLINFFDEMKDKYTDEKILIVSHGTAIHMMLLYFKNKPLKELWSVDIPNCAVTIVDYTDGVFSIEEEGLSFVPSVSKLFMNNLFIRED